ncbi:MAG: AlpA family phage regulatory protein [Burkholderiales bacterium]
MGYPQPLPNIARLRHPAPDPGHGPHGPRPKHTLYERIKDGAFPAQISLGARAVGWLRNPTAWIARQVDISRAR